MARSYDNIMQYFHTTGMIAQPAGEADVTVVDDVQDDSDDSQLNTTNKKGMSKQFCSQCEDMIRRLLGQRTSLAGGKWAGRLYSSLATSR